MKHREKQTICNVLAIQHNNICFSSDSCSRCVLKRLCNKSMFPNEFYPVLKSDLIHLCRYTRCNDCDFGNDGNTCMWHKVFRSYRKNIEYKMLKSEELNG